MKKVLLWIANIFKIDLTKEVVITKVETIYTTLDNEVNHDIIINGNLVVGGRVIASGEITCLNKDK